MLGILGKREWTEELNKKDLLDKRNLFQVLMRKVFIPQVLGPVRGLSFWTPLWALTCLFFVVSFL